MIFRGNETFQILVIIYFIFFLSVMIDYIGITSFDIN